MITKQSMKMIVDCQICVFVCPFLAGSVSKMGVATIGTKKKKKTSRFQQSTGPIPLDSLHPIPGYPPKNILKLLT